MTISLPESFCVVGIWNEDLINPNGYPAPDENQKKQFISIYLSGRRMNTFSFFDIFLYKHLWIEAYINLVRKRFMFLGQNSFVKWKESLILSAWTLQMTKGWLK